MSRVLDQADRAFWWLRDHLPVAGLLAVAFVAYAVLILTSLGGGTERSIPAGSVAVVGSAPITTTQLTHWQEVYSGAATASGAQTPTPAAARKAAFELLAGAQWVLEEAEEQRVTVSSKQVDDSITAYFTQAGATTKEARTTLQKQLGTNDADMRFQQRVSLLAAKLQQRAAGKAPKPTAEQIAAVYQREPARWARPSTRDIAAVVTADKAGADKARAALEGGTTFAKANADFSGNAQLTESKGIIKGLKNGDSGDAVDRAVFAAPLNELTGPVDTGAGFMVFKVTRSTPLPEQTLEQATKAITASLSATAQAKAGSAYLTSIRDRWRAKTKCTPAVRTADFCGGTPS